MSISFQESLNATKKNTTSAPAVMSLSRKSAPMATAIEYSDDEFLVSNKYAWYSKYHDDDYSSVDNKKNINVSPNQINIAQEENSQVIPFQLDRYYDGMDLMEMTFRIFFVNAEGNEGFSTPVNVTYSSDKIRFYWLVDNLVTAIQGNVAFEIQATGTNELGEAYCWKTRPNKNGINILESLQGNGMIEPSDEWYTQFIRNMDQKVAQAQESANEANIAATNANNAVIQANAALDRLNEAINSAKEELQDSVNEYVSSSLSGYYTSEQIDTLLENIDLTDVYNKIENIDGLAKFNTSYDPNTRVLSFYNGDTLIKSEILNSDPSDEWISEYDTKIEGKIVEHISPIQTDLSNYKESTNASLKDKAEKSTVNTITSELSATSAIANANKTSIVAVSEKVAKLEDSIGNVDNTPRYTYEATYDEEQIYTLWEIEGEGESEIRTPKGQFKIQGGGGSGGTSSVLKIEYVTRTPYVVTANDKAIIKFNFSGTDSSGDVVTEGTATWRVGNSVVATSMVIAGENSFDVTKYLSIGTQKIMLSITDDAGSLVTKSWTIQKIDVKLESNFNDTLKYPLGTISFDYIPYGAISKEVHFILDGAELPSVTTTSSGIPLSYNLPEQTHGSHLLEVYMTAEINGTVIETNHIMKDIIWYDASSDLATISCVQQEIVARQHDTINIQFTVHDPKTETPVVTLAVDGSIVSTLTMDSNTQIWQYKTSDIGTHVLTITCGDTVKPINVTIEKLDIDVTPITSGLAFDFNPTGKSNNDADRLWHDGDVSMTVSDNFDWVNGGYQIDENGDQYFCIKAGTSAVIDYKLFEDDAKRNGKEFKLVFKTTNVRKADTTFLKCIDGANNAKIGVQMNVHEAYVCASAGSLYLPYCEERIIEFEFNIAKNTADIPSIRGFEDGRGTWGLPYSDSHDFTQVNPQYITIGSPDCDVYIYRFKVYSAGLTDESILNNFIADARNADEMINRYKRNQIYDENNQLTKEHLAETCPWLRIIGIEAPYFTNNKSDKVKNSTIYWTYKNGDAILDNWIAYNSQHSGQGTTSNEYGQSSRNLDLIMNKDDAYFVLGDGVTHASEISLTSDSVPVAYLNVKVNVASQDNANNKCLAYLYNKFQPYQRPAKIKDSRVKDTMEFYNCVVFIRETDPDVSTHREFNDCEWHYYSFGNVGDSKKTDNTRLNDPTDPLEHIVEIMDNTLQNSIFPTGITDSEGKPVYPISPDQWCSGNTAYDTLYADPFDESMTYGWRYCYDDGNTEVTESCKEAWRNFYTFVVTSSNEDFKAHLKDYFVVETALFYYLFTHFFTMIDNRAKNSFWHYGKCADGIYRYDLCFGYDFDSGLGINNSGELTMSYGYEDTDYKVKGNASTGYAYNGALSVFFCRLRDLFADELNNMYIDRESAGCWNKTVISSLFNNSQNEFPEALWMIDDKRKYQRPFIEGAPRYYNTMMSGPKKWQREGYLDGQEPYMSSKHFGNTAVSDQIMFRCNTPTGENIVVQPDYTLHITPYADMYIDVMFGATYRTQVRAEAGKQYDIECPFTTMDDTAVLIYCSSMIQSMGDISTCYIHDNDFSKASRLRELIIGNTTEGYQNTFLTNLGIGNNTLLKKLDIQNTPNLAQTLNLSACGNLEELYAHGSGLTGVTFADSGNIRIAQLPAITSITMRNLAYLTGLDIAAFDNLTTLTIENCGTVDVRDLLEEAPNVNRVRITGINWEMEDVSLLERIYKMYGVDKNGYNISQSVLSGSVHVSTIREKKLADYQEVWQDLEISYDSIINQFPVTFANDDGTVLEVQYVDKGEKPVDPTTRADNPIPIPTKESTVSTDFTFAGWDLPFISVFESQTITATYSESIRKYTVRYVSRNTVLQESIGDYGSTIFYTGDTPVYTAEESAYKFHLFSHWDKSGFINGDKTINAVYDICEYTSGYFDGKDISSLRPVEIYAMIKMGVEPEHVQLKDSISFEFGHDYSFEDIQEHILISEQTDFIGNNYVDTGIKLFDEDRDFVLAIDYKFSGENKINAVLAQCYQTNGANGFRLWYNNEPKMAWGTSSSSPSSVNMREMLVLRHIKGENGLHMYTSNLSGDDVMYKELSKTKSTSTDATIVFGCAKADDGAYENYATGTVYWSKVWYADLGDEACRNLATWTHERRTFEMAGFKKFYLSDNSSKRCSMTFLDSHLLSRNMVLSDGSTNTEGWAACKLNARLNSRLYNALPIQWKQLIKQVQVSSSIGDKSTEISTSDCYITIPAVIEVEPSMTNEPYVYEGSTIPYFNTNQSRICTYDDGTPGSYWLRSPNASYSSYFYRVDPSGALYGYYYAYDANGAVRIMFSI